MSSFRFMQGFESFKMATNSWQTVLVLVHVVYSVNLEPASQNYCTQR
jgi:hypothetical protein